MKAAPVDLDTGTLTAERYKIATPQPATPEAMAEVVRRLVEHFGWQGTVGVAFPAVVRNGVARTAANIDRRGSAPTSTPCSRRRRAARST